MVDSRSQDRALQTANQLAERSRAGRLEGAQEARDCGNILVLASLMKAITKWWTHSEGSAGDQAACCCGPVWSARRPPS